MKEGAEQLPRHPKPGVLSYRNWFGINVSTPPALDALSFRAKAVADYGHRAPATRASVLVAGWAMSNMSPLDFLWSDLPLFNLDANSAAEAEQLAQAATLAATALVSALREALGIEASGSTLLDPEREAFFRATEPTFIRMLDRLAAGQSPSRPNWLRLVCQQALRQFDDIVMAGLADLDLVPRDTDGFSRRPTVKRVIAARRKLLNALRGNKMHDLLALPRPERKKKRAKV